MTAQDIFKSITVLLSAVLLTGCGLVGLQPPIVVTEDVDPLHTAAAQTIEVKLTQIANQTLEAITTQLAVTSDRDGIPSAYGNPANGEILVTYSHNPHANCNPTST